MRLNWGDTDRRVEVFHQNMRVASHPRSHAEHRHTTLSEHMPRAHQEARTWSAARINAWADRIGPSTLSMVKLLKLPKGSIVVFDRGYNDYTWFRQLCKSDVFLVTRLKSNARLRVIERHRTERAKGVTSDHIIQVADGQKTLTLRRIGYRDQETGKRFKFLTNHMTLPARTIADIYKDDAVYGFRD